MAGRQFRTFAVSVFAGLLLAGLAHAAESHPDSCQCTGTVVRDTLTTVNKVHLPSPLQVTLHKGTGDGMMWFNATKKNLWILPFETDPGFEGRPHAIAVPKGKWSHCYCVSNQAENRVYHYYVGEQDKVVEWHKKKMQVGGVIVAD